MRKTDEQIKAQRDERKRAMCVRLVTHLNVCKCETYEQIPVRLRSFFEGLQYGDIVRPLIKAENERGVSVSMLCIRYHLSENAVRNHLAKKDLAIPCED